MQPNLPERYLQKTSSCWECPILRKNIQTFGATLPKPCVLSWAGFLAERVCVCVIVSICQDKQVPDSVRREKEHQSVGQMCAEVGFDWLTGSVCVIWKQFVWKCEKGCRGLVRLWELLSHPFSHKPFTCTQTHSYLFQRKLLFGRACTCTL